MSILISANCFATYFTNNCRANKFKCFLVVSLCMVCLVQGAYCNTRRLGGIDRGGHRNEPAMATMETK